MLTLDLQFVNKESPKPHWSDLQGKKILNIDDNSPPIPVLIIDKGMTSGKPSIMLRLDTEVGTVIVQTSARLFCTAARAVMAKYPDLFKD